MSGSWYELLSIRQEAKREFDFWASTPPPACPNDGEPLLPAPGDASGTTLYCKYDGWQYPRDWTRPVRAEPMPLAGW